jgi:glutaredoxin
MIERVLILVVVVFLAFAVVSLRERARPRRLRARPGITVFTGPGCRLCPALLTALEATGVRYRTVDVTRNAAPGVRALPTVLVADHRGEVAMRRSGRSALTDLDALVAFAAGGPVRGPA